MTVTQSLTPFPRHVHLDAVGGMAGDMFVAAMLSALPQLVDRVMADVAAVLPAGTGTARLEPGTSNGLAVLRFRLDDGGEAARSSHSKCHGDHQPAPSDSSHARAEGHLTHFPDLRRLIETAPLASGTAEKAIDILTELAVAEARVHGVGLDEVHFHEVADWDSLMDVVAAGSIAAALGAACWSASDLPQGGGLVRTSHGLLPMPAPATAVLLEGFRLRDDGIGGERVTPTGAAILAALVTHATIPAGARLAASGIGAGTRSLPGIPNIVRALAFADVATSVDAVDAVDVISFDVDDMTGEEIGIAADRLRAIDGVLDLTIGQRLGKKGRPVADFRLLVRPERSTAIDAACFAETSTIGLRRRREDRRVLARTFDLAEVDGRTIRRKSSVRPDRSVVAKAESDDLAGLAGGLEARRRIKRLAENPEG